MTRIAVKNLIPGIIILNQNKIVLNGNESKIIDCDSDVKVDELRILAKQGIVSFGDTSIEGQNDKIEAEVSPNIEEKVRKAEELTQKEGSRVVIGTGGGVVEGKMTKSAVDDQLENVEASEAVRASLEAMKKIEEEEHAEEDDMDLVDKIEALPKNQAIVVDQGTQKRVNMVNNIANQSIDGNRDPFIDKEVNKHKSKLDKLSFLDIDVNQDENDENDDLIE